MKKKILGIAAIVIVIAALLGVYYAFREQPKNPNVGPSSDGDVSIKGKNVTIEVIDDENNSVTYSLTTHAEYLEGAMNEAEGLTYEAKDGMVMTVNGKRADYNLDGAFWGFYVNGKFCNYGFAEQPVNDGDEFRIEYTKA